MDDLVASYNYENISKKIIISRSEFIDYEKTKKLENILNIIRKKSFVLSKKREREITPKVIKGNIPTIKMKKSES